MLVLPKLRQPLPSASQLPFAASDRVRDQAPGALLPYWSIPIYSELPEESEGRAAIMETYLLCLSRLVWMRNTSLNAITSEALSALMRDEEIEREFIEEDAQVLPYGLYIDFTISETHAYFWQQEAVMRAEIAREHSVASLLLAEHMEEIHRMHVATQFLDSLFLKLSQLPLFLAPCALAPGRASDSDSSPSLLASAAELFTAEAADRDAIAMMCFDGVRLAVEVRAEVEKRKMYNEALRGRVGVTSRAVMNRRATIIQSVFRGRRVRRIIAKANAAAEDIFVFIGENQQLHLLEKGTHQESYVIYGGKVLAFACGEVGDFIALALPFDREKANTHTNNQQNSVVRIYRFADGGLGEMVGEITSTLTISQLLWVGSRFLVACGPAGCAIYTWHNERLEFFVTDPAVAAFLQGSHLGLHHKKDEAIEFWDLNKNSMVDSIKLSRCKRRSRRPVVAVTGSGCFTFVLHDDGDVRVFYVTRTRVKEVNVLERLLPREDYADGVHELVACALSSRKVLLGRRGDSRVLKLEYQNERAVVVGRQEDLPAPLALVAISTDGRRCLTINRESSKYRTTVLNFSASRLNDAASPGEAMTSEASPSASSIRESTATTEHDSERQKDLVKNLSNKQAMKTEVSPQPMSATTKASTVVETKKNGPDKTNTKKDGNDLSNIVIIGPLVASIVIVVYAIFRSI